MTPEQLIDAFSNMVLRDPWYYSAYDDQYYELDVAFFPNGAVVSLRDDDGQAITSLGLDLFWFVHIASIDALIDFWTVVVMQQLDLCLRDRSQEIYSFWLPYEKEQLCH